MRKALKIGAILIGIVVAVVVVAVIAAIVLIDPNRYREDIVQIVKERTGRDLRIDGDIKLTIFPWLGLETGKLQFSNAPGFGPEPMAVVNSAGIKVELIPLLRKEVRIDAVRLMGLTLNLARAANGQTNWADLAKPSATPEKSEPTQSSDPTAALAAFSVNRLEVRDAEFTWRDQTAGTFYALRRVELTSGNLVGDSPAPLHLAFDLESGKPKVARRVQLDARLNANLNTQALNVPDLRLTMGELKAQAQVRASNIMESPKANGRIDVSPFNLRALLQELGIAYAPADPNALKRVGLVAQFDYGPQAIAISELRLALDDTALTGNVALQQQPRKVYRFNLAIDNLDIDRYTPPADASANKSEKTDAAKATVIPLALLRDNDADGQLRIGKLKAAGIHSEQVTIKVNANKGRIVLGPNEAKLYNGVYAGRTVLDASGATPTFQFDEKLTGVQLGPLLKDADLFDRYTGTGNVDLKLTARGLDATQIKRTLSGTAAVALHDGKIQGVNLQKIVQQARSLFDQARGKEVPAQTQATDETAFKSLTATAKLTNGVARNDDLKLEGPVVRATGTGSADLAQETFDYRLQVTVAEGEGRAGTTVPVRVSGSFTDPKYGVDFSSLLKQQTKPVEQKLEKKLDEKKEETRDKLRNRLLEKLKR